MRPFAALLSIVLSTLAAAQTSDAPANGIAHFIDTWPGSITIRNGAPLVVRNKVPIFSAELHVGDAVPFEVVKPVKADGLTVIANGAVATCRVTLLEKSERKGRGAKIEITFDSVQLVTGKNTPIRATTSQEGGNEDDMAGDLTVSTVHTSGVSTPD